MASKRTGRTIECFVLADDRGDDAAPAASDGDGAVAYGSELASVLLRRTREWGQGVAGAEAKVIEGPSEARKAFESGCGALLLLRPALARLGPGHASDLASDLDSGCDVVIGPTLAGGWYLLALNPGDVELLDAAGDGGPGSAGRLLAVARERDGLEVGLLRAERDLGSAADLRAAAADPLVDMEVARLLSASGRGPAGEAQ